MLAEEQIVDTVHIERTMVRGHGEIFGLRVQGDSMIEAGIFSGDYVFIRKQSTANRGEIVAAMISNVTLAPPGQKR